MRASDDVVKRRQMTVMVGRSWVRGRQTTLVCLVGFVLGLVYAAATLGQYGWDPAGAVQFGEREAERVAYANEVFGREIPLAPQLGHDGRFFFIQAMDPLLLDPESHAMVLDRPAYRAQRMLYPTLASLGRLAGPEGIALALLAVNVIAFAAGTWATARLAVTHGLSAWWGLAFPLNPGVRFELDISGAGVTAFALLVLGMLALVRDRPIWASVSFAAAALSREVMLLGALLAVVAWRPSSRPWLIRVRVVLPAVLGSLLWAVYVRWRLGSAVPTVDVQELGIPLRGILAAVPQWLESPGIDLALGAVYMLLIVAVLVRAWLEPGMPILVAAGFAAIGLVLTRQVWLQHFDISRALAPMLTLYILDFGVRQNRTRSRASNDPGAVVS